MRVAFLAFDFGEYCVRLAGALAADHELMLIVPDSVARPYLSFLQGNVTLRLFSKPRLRQVLTQVAAVLEIHRYIKEFAPDVVHIQAGHMWLNLSLHWLRNYPIVLTVHDAKRHPGDAGLHHPPQWVMDYGPRCAKEIIVHAPQIKEELADRLSLRREHIHVIPHILIGDSEASCHVSEEEGTILFFGRIWPYKGVDVLIQAEPQITSVFPHARIVIAGEGEDLERYRRMISNPDNYQIMNYYISDEQRADLFRKASVVVLPYIEASQSGVVPIAYTYEKPVVATTVGGLPDAVEHARTGLLVPPGDKNALADAVIKLLQDRELRHRFGAAGKRKLQEQCAPELIARKTSCVYDRALRKDRWCA